MKVIIVSNRYFGDCLLSAALSDAIKSEIPDALVDILTFCGNETILENISSIDHVITMPKSLSVLGIIKKFIHKRNYYDWALITQTSDRALFGYPKNNVRSCVCAIICLISNLGCFHTRYHLFRGIGWISKAYCFNLSWDILSLLIQLHHPTQAFR